MEKAKDQAKQFQVAEIQLSYKSNVLLSLRPQISSSSDAYQILKDCWDDSKLELIEQFKILLTNRANRVLGIFEVLTGGISGTVSDPKLIFAAALKVGASGMILSHNHPSGNFKPSQDLTKKIKIGGNLLEINVLDHIILTSKSFYSFADL